MAKIRQVPVEAKSLHQLFALLGSQDSAHCKGVLSEFHERLGERVFWHINSTAKGGGVAEMLPSLLGYMRDFRIDARWLVITGDPSFFTITKRLHHALHGSSGDGSCLGERERKVYQRVLQEHVKELFGCVQPRDVVVLHDPQTAALIRPLVDRGCSVIWRCHIGQDKTNLAVKQGWAFLSKFLQRADAYVFSRKAYIPSVIDKDSSLIIAPSIDPLSPKNEPMREDAVRCVLTHIGLLEGEPSAEAGKFLRYDGTLGQVRRRADIVRSGKALSWHKPLIVQVSRWDPLKDHQGVLKGFLSLLQEGLSTEADLVLVGPDVKSLADDPEGGRVFREMESLWLGLSDELKRRVHLVTLPMEDVEENALMVNAIQHHASVLVQKSLHEGFGLTVTEAMWKAKPVIASAVGGIVDQIEHGNSGLLLKNPRDMKEFCEVLRALLEDRALGAKLGKNAKQRVTKQFLTSRHIEDYLRTVEFLDSRRESAEEEQASSA